MKMFEGWFGSGKQQEKVSIPTPTKKEPTLAQLERKKAIETLQRDLATNKTSSEEVVKKRKEALLKLLENDITEDFGEDLVTDKELFHYSEPPKTSANDSNLDGKQRA